MKCGHAAPDCAPADTVTWARLRPLREASRLHVVKRHVKVVVPAALRRPSPVAARKETAHRRARPPRGGAAPRDTWRQPLFELRHVEAAAEE